MGDVIDVSERLAPARWLLDAQSPALDPMFARGLFSTVLAFMKWANIDPEQLAVLIAAAQDAESIEAGTLDILNALDYQG